MSQATCFEIADTLKHRLHHQETYLCTPIPLEIGWGIALWYLTIQDCFRELHEHKAVDYSDCKEGVLAIVQEIFLKCFGNEIGAE